MRTDPTIHAVDDDWRFRSALERTLRSTGIAVRGYACASQFLDGIDPRQPGCLITDLRMPDMDGLELQRGLKQRGIEIPVIFITGHGDARNAVAALKAGAIDFLEKPFSEHTVLESVLHALQKDAEYRRLESEKETVKQRCEALSPRERQVFALVVSDLPNKQVAARLRISPRTVEHHREHVMLKMQAHSANELIIMAMLCGIRELHL